MNAPRNTAIDSTGQASLSDEALVRRMRREGAAVGEELVRRYCQPLVGYLRRLCGSEQLAEELHQQTWLSVLEHLDKFDPAASGGFRSWVFRIATNKANDYWRNNGRQRMAMAGLRLVSEQEAPPAGQRMEGSEEEKKLMRAIQQLPESQRQVLLLRYYSEMKFVDIAHTLGCPLNTALGRMHKAMIRLRELMGEDAGPATEVAVEDRHDAQA